MAHMTRMKRTLATISTPRGIARIVHDSETMDLTAILPDGIVESLSDYTPTASYMTARKQIVAWYSCRRAYHDTWVLCLRPLATLRIARTEA